MVITTHPHEILRLHHPRPAPRRDGLGTQGAPSRTRSAASSSPRSPAARPFCCAASSRARTSPPVHAHQQQQRDLRQGVYARLEARSLPACRQAGRADAQSGHLPWALCARKQKRKAWSFLCGTVLSRSPPARRASAWPTAATMPSRFLPYAPGGRGGRAPAGLPELCLTGTPATTCFASRRSWTVRWRALSTVLEATRHLSLPPSPGCPSATGTAPTTAPSSSSAARCSASCRKRTFPITGVQERRFFTPGGFENVVTADLGNGRTAPFGTHLLFSCRSLPDFVLGIEICEDLWVPEPPP